MNPREIDFPAAAAPKKARIEIIPLIDVIFFLLATFVLFTLSLDRIRAIPVDLPQPVVTPVEPDGTVYVQATDGGGFFWKEGRDGVSESITAAELAPRLADYRQRVRVPRVLVRGDGLAKFGPAILALDEVRKAGIAQVSIETVVSPAGR